jgi:hypothetical protein
VSLPRTEVPAESTSKHLGRTSAEALPRSTTAASISTRFRGAKTMGEHHIAVLVVTYQGPDEPDRRLEWVASAIKRTSGVDNVSHLDPRPAADVYRELMALLDGGVIPIRPDEIAGRVWHLVLEAYRMGAKAMYTRCVHGDVPVPQTGETRTVIYEDAVVRLAEVAAGFAARADGFDLVVPSRTSERWLPTSHVVLQNADGQIESFPWTEVVTLIRNLADVVTFGEGNG